MTPQNRVRYAHMHGIPVPTGFPSLARVRIIQAVLTRWDKAHNHIPEITRAIEELKGRPKLPEPILFDVEDDFSVSDEELRNIRERRQRAFEQSNQQEDAGEEGALRNGIRSG